MTDAAHRLAEELGTLLPSDALELARQRNPGHEIAFSELSEGTIRAGRYVSKSELVVRHQGREARWQKRPTERWFDVFRRAGLL